MNELLNLKGIKCQIFFIFRLEKILKHDELSQRFRDPFSLIFQIIKKFLFLTVYAKNVENSLFYFLNVSSSFLFSPTNFYFSLDKNSLYSSKKENL
jgi:hypothetical protein